jgi:ferritin
MTLKDWIATQDRTKLIKTLSVSRQTLSQWCSYHCLPTAAKWIAVHKASKGKVDILQSMTDYRRSKLKVKN